MNWFTRCPECATVYKVVPDQLRVASGWLRCGHCQQAFDSTGLVLEWSESVSSSDALLHVDQRLVIDDLLHHQDRSAPVLAEANRTSTSVSTDAMSELTAFSDALSSFRPGMPPSVSQDGPLVDSPLQAEALTPERSVVTDSGVTAIPSARGGRFRRLVIAVLSLLLVVQGVWSQRHALVTFVPATAPFVQQLCRVSGCQIQAWRQSDGLVIDSSDFVPQPGGFALRWTVRNTTELTLGMTALELKLQDAQDKVLVRRVFSASEVGAPVSLLPGQTWSGQLFIEIATDLPITGYRLLSFYP